MKHTLKTILAAIIGIMASACSHNNGDIGPWYGQWKLEAIEADGQPIEGYGGNMFWSFQNNIVCLNQVNDNGLNYIMRWATWKQDGQTLLLDFTHSDSSSPAPDANFSPFPILGLEKNAVNALTIEKLSSSHLVLKYDAGDKLYAYRLRKWG